MNSEELIRLENLTLKYKLINGEITVFNSINLIIEEGEKIGIHGPSGSGKTSLFKMLSGLIDPTYGKRIINGSVKFIHQFPQCNPWLTCRELLEIALEDGHIVSTPNDLLNEFNMSEFRDHLFFQLSEGQKQCISILFVLATGIDILLADEPFSRLEMSEIQEVFLESLYIYLKNLSQ